MPRWYDDCAHGNPHRDTLGRTALLCVAIYTLAAVLGWTLIGVLAAWVLSS
jgi:hypothetical protein